VLLTLYHLMIAAVQLAEWFEVTGKQSLGERPNIGSTAIRKILAKLRHAQLFGKALLSVRQVGQVLDARQFTCAVWVSNF
jgi:hypothetical protein